jgi:hypothetical protein
VGEVATPKSNSGGTSSKVIAVDERTFTAMMEQLQEGYVTSVAATAGCAVEPIPKDVYGCDLRLVRPGRVPTEEEVSLLVQLKNTTTAKPDPTKEFFSYQLRKREYLERLAIRRTLVKAILVVMATSHVQTEWTTVSHHSMELKHCCYWQSFEGYPVNPTVVSPSVRIPTANIFDSMALTQIMDKLSRGESLS